MMINKQGGVSSLSPWHWKERPKSKEEKISTFYFVKMILNSVPDLSFIYVICLTMCEVLTFSIVCQTKSHLDVIAYVNLYTVWQNNDWRWFPLCHNFRKFRSKHKWNASAQVEIFRKSGPPPEVVLFDRSVRTDRNLPFHFQNSRFQSHFAEK